MPEATRKLLYQLNRRWIFGKIVSSPPFSPYACIRLTAVVIRTTLRILFKLLSLAGRQLLTCYLTAAPARDCLSPPDHGCLTHRPQVQ